MDNTEPAYPLSPPQAIHARQAGEVGLPATQRPCGLHQQSRAAWDTTCPCFGDLSLAPNPPSTPEAPTRGIGQEVVVVSDLPGDLVRVHSPEVVA